MSTARNIADLLNASGKIVTGKIADDAVTAALLADDAVTAAKIHDAVALGGGLASVQIFTSSGTWTKPSGIKLVKAYATGGGGGGSIVYYNGDSAGGGGGGGGTGIVVLDVSSISSLTVTIGTGGANGGSGGTTTFGSSPAYCTGHGGHGGWNEDGNGHLSGGKGGGGGCGTSSIINASWLVRGNAGPVGEYHSDRAGSPGGGSYWCGNGWSQTHYAASVAGIWGGGGAGRNSAYGGTGNPNNSGASSGGAGVVVVEEYK